MLLHSTFAVVFISVVAVARSEVCQGAETLQKLLTCTFSGPNGTCDWKVHDRSSTPEWKIDSDRFAVPKNTDFEIVQLKSPLICPTTGNILLSFKYVIQNSNCNQSVILEDTGNQTVWWATSDSNQNMNEMQTNITIDAQFDNFKIVLQSYRTSSGYCQIRLGDIVFKYIDQGSGSTSPLTDVTKDGGPSGPGGESAGAGLSGEGIAGVIVSLVVVIAVLAIAFFLLRKRKTGGKQPFQKLFERFQTIIQTSSGSTTDAQAAARTNRPIIDGPYPEITSESGRLPKCKDYYSVPSDSVHGNNKETKPGHGTHYAVSDLPETSNYYSMPRDSTGAYGGGKQTGDNPGYVAEDDGGYSTPDDIDRPENTQKTNKTQNARSGKKWASGDSYNKISFQHSHDGSSCKASDTYNHINPLEHADTSSSTGVEDDDNQYKVPRSDDAEYSLATDPGDPYDRPPTTPTSKTQKTDLTGRMGAPCANNTNYSHLNLKNGGSPPTGATSGKEEGQGVYSHLEG